jgi:hypothetical protein
MECDQSTEPRSELQLTISVTATAPDDVWAFGYSGAALLQIQHFDGAE